MRKLATLRKVSEIRPIEKSDLLELAIVDGWKCVVKKDEFQVNDMCIYCEIDSFLPIREEFEFLRKSSYKKMADGSEGFRLKSIRLRGQISQGLLLPLSILIDKTVYTDISIIDIDILTELFKLSDIGTDVSDRLGIIKYEPPVPANLSGVAKGGFPSFIPKTDEERVQNLPEILIDNKDDVFYTTEKLDGSSITIYLNRGEFGVCSRNLDLLETEDNTFWKVARSMDLERKMDLCSFNVALQGELIGEGIQGNPYKLKGQTIRFYNVFYIDKHEYADFHQFTTIIKGLGLETVPIIDVDFRLPNTIDELLSIADGKSVLNAEFDREGLVFRTKDGDRLSFKAISNLFLLNGGN